MKQLMIMCVVGVALLGAGCGKEPAGTPGVSSSSQAQRVVPASAAKPTAAPQIPEAAKNIPRPEAK